MLGRYNLGETTSTFHPMGNQKSIFGNTLPILKGADLVIGNLETPITTNTTRTPKEFNYRIDPHDADRLLVNDNLFFNIGNNHILDYGFEGLIDTMKFLNTHGVGFSGAGIDDDDAIKYTLYHIEGIRIGILGCSDHYQSWKADYNQPGINLVDYSDYTQLRQNIKHIKTEVDILILSIHWGSNYDRNVDRKHKKFADDVLNDGVDIIHGHSSHHVKYVDRRTDKLVIYGMGDFIDDYGPDKTYHIELGMIIEVEVDQNGVKDVNIIPTKTSNRQVNVATSSDDITYVHQQSHI